MLNSDNLSTFILCTYILSNILLKSWTDLNYTTIENLEVLDDRIVFVSNSLTLYINDSASCGRIQDPQLRTWTLNV